MRVALITILFVLILILSSFSTAILEFQNCPSIANSNFTLNVISDAQPVVVLETPNERVTINQVNANLPIYAYNVNFSNATKNLYILIASAGSTIVKCGFAYASPELTTTRIPDSNLLIVVLSVLACAFVVFRKAKK